MNWIERFRATAERHRFSIAIAFVIAIACTMTAVSLSLYASSGTRQLDLSRPGYETARKEIINPDDTSTFSPNGAIDKKTLEQYQKLFDNQRKEMNTLSRFKDSGLGDPALGLSAPEQEQPQQ